jgi:hypothetical protein
LETVVVISSILSSTEVMGGMDDEESDEANLMTWERWKWGSRRYLRAGHLVRKRSRPRGEGRTNVSCADENALVSLEMFDEDGAFPGGENDAWEDVGSEGCSEGGRGEEDVCERGSRERPEVGQEIGSGFLQGHTRHGDLMSLRSRSGEIRGRTYLESGLDDELLILDLLPLLSGGRGRVGFGRDDVELAEGPPERTSDERWGDARGDGGCWVDRGWRGEKGLEREEGGG